MTRFSTDGYKHLKFEFATAWDGFDPWASVMEWWFAVAEFLYHEGETLPASWEFRDSPVHAHGYEPEGYPAEMVDDLYDEGLITLADVHALGDVLTKYAGILKLAGKDY
jgi:hypothetical protein